MRVLVFGASTAQGLWDTEGGWVARVRKHYDMLQVQNPEVEQPRVLNVAIMGDGTKELLQRFDSEAKARSRHEPVSFIIAIGTNDAAILKGRPMSDIETYKSHLVEIVETAKKYSDKIMFAGLPPVDEKRTTPISWVDMHFTNDRIAEFEAAMGMVAQQNGIPFAPFMKPLLERIESGTDLAAFDGLHSNDTGHALMAELVQPKLDSLLA